MGSTVSKARINVQERNLTAARRAVEVTLPARPDKTAEDDEPPAPDLSRAPDAPSLPFVSSEAVTPSSNPV
jgi:hypothetical protein